MSRATLAAVIVMLGGAAAQVTAQATPVRIDFSGDLTYGTISDYGAFTGSLTADWDRGVVYQFYTDVTYGTGEAARYEVLPNWDMVGVVQGALLTQYWSDGSVAEYSVAPETELSVSRYHRDQNGAPSIGPDPDWEMVLEIAPRGIWGWSDDEYQIVSCGSPGAYCWEQVSAFNAFGTITSVITRPVPEPASVWLLLPGLAALAGGVRGRF